MRQQDDANLPVLFEELEARTMLSVSPQPAALVAELPSDGYRLASALATQDNLSISRLTATLSGPRRVSLTWSGAPAATGYRISRSTDGITFTRIARLVGGQIRSYTDRGLASGTPYTYKVKAFSATSVGSGSRPALVTTPLAAPANVAAVASAPTRVAITWTNMDSGAAGIYVLRSSNGVTFAKVADVRPAATNRYTDTVLSGRRYYYRVQAYKGTVTSAISSTLSATTPLAASSGLVAAAVTPTRVHLSWARNDPSATGFYVLRSSDGVTFSKIWAITSPNALSFVDLTPAASRTYQYRVQAFNALTTAGVSNTALASTPRASVLALSVAVGDGASVQLRWTDTGSTATAHRILRSTDNVHFETLATVDPAAEVIYSDADVSVGRVYYYRVQAYVGAYFSAVSNSASVAIRPAAPSELSATLQEGASVRLEWTNNDEHTVGYRILRSDDGISFRAVGTIGSADLTTYRDETVLTGHRYDYKVQALAGTVASVASGAASVTLPLVAPSDLVATISGNAVVLQWTNNDLAANGFVILRSTDGASFSELVRGYSASVTSYTDTAVFAGQTYHYRIQACNTYTTSDVSNTADATTPAGPASGSSRRFDYDWNASQDNTEVVINLTGTDDTLLLAQDGPYLKVTINGWLYHQEIPAAGAFVYTRGGDDTVVIDPSVTVRTTVQTIDYGTTTITSAGANVSVWMDSTDLFSGSGYLHSVASYAGGTSKGYGDKLPEPSDMRGPYYTSTYSLWGPGPTPDDVNQGGAGDCYYVAGLAALAATNPTLLQETAVDMGDGTYTVQYYDGTGTPSYVRVSNLLSMCYTRMSRAHTVWAMVLEKAFCYTRGGANTYASLWGGYDFEAFWSIAFRYTSFHPGSDDDESLFDRLSTALENGQAVALSSTSGAGLVANHAYSLLRVYKDADGVNHYVVRNPWGPGHPGVPLENSEGIADLTYGQFVGNFSGGSICA